MTEPRPPWYERFGGIGHDSATQSISKTGIPVPPGGTFQGRPPRGRRNTEAAVAESSIEERWSEVSRCNRRAEVTQVDWLTRTGTLRLGFEVTDDRPFDFEPGNFLRVERHDPERGFHRGTYCLASPPSEYRRFDLLVRVVRMDGMSGHLASLRLGDEVAFRGPTGRSMLKAAGNHDLVLVATGVGIAPLYSLAMTLLRAGTRRRIDVFWGLRSVEDICLTRELDRLAERYPNFRYRISLSEPSADWTDLSGRVTESVPPLLTDLDRPRFLLAGNGAMTEEFAAALSEVGVPRETIYEEPYFNGRHVADPAVVAGIVDRLPA